MARDTGSLETEQHAQKEEYPRALENGPNEKYQITAFIERLPNEGHATNDKRRAEEEGYWRRQVFWQCVTACATICAFGAAIWYACIAKRQWETMQQQLEVAQRPWISVAVSLAGPFTFTADGGATLKVQFDLKNIGNSPARDVWIESEVFLLDEERHDTVEEQSKLCEPMRRVSNSFGEFLFPGEGFHAPTLDVTIRQANVAKALKRSTSGGGITPTIIGCADYRFAFTEDHHQTSFIYYLLQNDPHRRHPSVIDPQSGSIPVEYLLLERAIFCCYAD